MPEDFRATDARAMADEGVHGIHGIIEMIKQSAAAGFLCLVYYGDLSSTQVYKLRIRGFRVEKNTANGNEYWDITWFDD